MAKMGLRLSKFSHINILSFQPRHGIICRQILSNCMVNYTYFPFKQFSRILLFKSIVTFMTTINSAMTALLHGYN